jgi:hypothetical protein
MTGAHARALTTRASASMVLKQILPLISVSARPVPWGAVERGSCIGTLPATGSAHASRKARTREGAHARSPPARA